MLKNRKRTRLTALALAVMMVVTMMLGGLTAYAENSATEWADSVEIGNTYDPDAPKTGDETHRNFWFLMMGISAAGILFMTRKKEQE